MERIIKFWKTNQKKQEYKYKRYGRIFVENPQIKHYPYESKDLVLNLYTNGAEIATIARSLEIPYETIRSCYPYGMLKSKICGHI